MVAGSLVSELSEEDDVKVRAALRAGLDTTQQHGVPGPAADPGALR